MQKKPAKDLVAENEELRTRLEEAQETLDAISRGEVDGLVVSTPKGEQVYTISGADKPYRVLIEEMREGAVMISKDNIVLYCNTGFAKMMKLPLDKIVGGYIQNMVLPTHKTDFEKLLYRARTGKGAFSKEITLKANDDKPVPTYMSVNSVKMENIVTTFLVATDLTEHMEEDLKRYTSKLETEINERKKAEEELRKSQEMEYSQRKELEALMETVPATIWISHDPKCSNMTGNKATYDLLGLPKSVNVSITASEKQRPTNFLAYDNQGKPIPLPDLPMQMAARTGKPVFNSEFEFRFEDGRSIWVYGNVTPLRDAQGNPQGAVGAYVDITQIKKMQTKLEDYAKNLEKLVEERTKQVKDSERLATIGATAGMVGHDIRNPLQTVTGEIFLAKDELKNLPEGSIRENLEESLDIIEEQTTYVNKIVADLQDYAKPIVPKYEEVNLENIVKNVLSSICIPNEESVEEIKIAYFIDKGFPKLKVDESYMRRILQNLVTNAIQAMPNGGNLTISANCRGDKVNIVVEDTGGGIPFNVRDKLFMPLITTKAKGQGFGLAVVKRFTEGMGGTVTFESEVGKGTKFTIVLPL
jgi:PAS domain S-box-containing protein